MSLSSQSHVMSSASFFSVFVTLRNLQIKPSVCDLGTSEGLE